eukprot:1136919-Pelagomonas_calceolata.AAC.3
MGGRARPRLQGLQACPEAPKCWVLHGGFNRETDSKNLHKYKLPTDNQLTLHTANTIKCQLCPNKSCPSPTWGSAPSSASWTEFENFMSNEFASGKTLLSGEYGEWDHVA